MSAVPVLSVERLTKRFPGVVALREVSFDLRPGEVHALCGENGAGKSTLIRCLSGGFAHGTYEGEIALGGAPARFTGIADARAAGIAVVHQELALVGEMTVAENVHLGAEPLTRGLFVDWDLVYARTRALLTRYGLPLDPAARVGDLGVARQQLVEIARALSKEPRILLLDEPTAALAQAEADRLLGIVRDLSRHGVSCLYISHRLEEVLEIADRVTILCDGSSAGTLERAEATRDGIIRRMVGRELGELTRRSPHARGEKLLSVRGLSVRDPESGKRLLDDVSFDLQRGEVLGIGGLMGAGRTELLMHLYAGAGERCAGEVELCGVPLAGNGPAGSLARGMALVGEDRKRHGLVLDQEVGFNLSLSSLRRLTRRRLIDGDAEVRENRRLFDGLRVKAPGLSTLVATLSGGNQQKVVLGKALMTQPQVVLLDEPTRGIDVGAKREVYELVDGLVAEGKAVLLASSEMPELLGVADRLLVLSRGRVGGSFPDTNVTQDDLLRAAMACGEEAPR